MLFRRARARKPSGRRHGAWRLGRRGAVSIIFACTLPLLAIAVGVGIDFSRIADARAALQRSVDGAALSGAAAYVLYAAGDAYNAVAVSTATAAFCRAAAVLPAGATLVASTGAGTNHQCGGGPGTSIPGPAIAAVIGGYVPGTRGAAANTGCSATNTVVAGVTCGFLVTVTASATVTPAFSGLLGGAQTVTATATAANPFLDLGSALTVNLIPSGAHSADSLWVYPLLLDANGSPDFVSDAGARPPTTGCTGAPDQTVCGSYTMLASTYYQAPNCPQSKPCNTADGATLVSGVVQHPKLSAAVVTATTPLGFAFEATNGGVTSYGLDGQNGNGTNVPASFPLTSGCSWPDVTAYHTVTQVYLPAPSSGQPPQLSAALEGRNPDGSINWTLTTHWFYSSFLANPAKSYPPSYGELMVQGSNNQKVQSVPTTDPKVQCNDTARLTTTYPTTNCSLYIVKDPSPTTSLPDPSYSQNSVCWAPSATPGQQYAALSCQGFAGHKFVFLWNNTNSG